MKIKIQYATKERIWHSSHTYSNVMKEVELEPIHIIRYPCGSVGEAKNRFYYSGVFIAPDDAEFVTNGTIQENIFRKTNPKFNPKKLNFNGRTCELSASDSVLSV